MPYLSLNESYIFWGILAIVLAMAEMLSLSFILVFFSLGAGMAGIAGLMGVGINLQLLIFSVTSLFLLFLLRKKVKEGFTQKESTDHFVDIGARVKVLEDIKVGDEGVVHYSGTTWRAFSDDKNEIPAGTMAEIVSLEGIRLKVKTR